MLFLISLLKESPILMTFLVERCGEMVMSMETSAHRPVPAPFLSKTYQLVDDPCTDQIVSWGEDETTFVVWRPPEFARDLLPKYFKHNNFSSFVRQLNTYGFRKIVADRWEFANDLFRKGARNLLSEIHRRKAPQLPPPYFQQHFNHSGLLYHHNPDDLQVTSWPIESPLPAAPPPPTSGGNDAGFMSNLSEDNQRLRKRNSFLLSELTHMKQLYNDIACFLQNRVSPVPAPEQRMTVADSGPKPCRITEMDSSDNHYNNHRQHLDQSHSLSYQHYYKSHESSNCEAMPAANTTEPADGSGDSARSTVKLFGVALHVKKRLHSDRYQSEQVEVE